MTADSKQPGAHVFDAIKWDEQGLIPAIAQDAKTGRVLMLAYINRDAFMTALQKLRRQMNWPKVEAL